MSDRDTPMSRFEIWGDWLANRLVWAGSFMWLSLAYHELLRGDTPQAIANAAVVGILVCGRQLQKSLLWHLDRWKERAIAAIKEGREDQ